MGFSCGSAAPEGGAVAPGARRRTLACRKRLLPGLSLFLANQANKAHLAVGVRM